MIRTIPLLLAMLLTLIPIGRSQAASYNPFASAMSAMADVMRDYADHNIRDRGLYNSTDTTDLFILYRNMPGAIPRSPMSKTQLLDGIWRGRYGEIIMIRDGFFRIYTYSYNHFEDGYLAVQGRLMQIKSARTGHIKSYEFAHRGDRLILRETKRKTLFRERNNALMLYKRINLRPPRQGYGLRP